jgi:hypothetical protein
MCAQGYPVLAAQRPCKYHALIQNDPIQGRGRNLKGRLYDDRQGVEGHQGEGDTKGT